ncbi:MAG: glycoside hydrolase family 43 protein [Treponema sp.]|nr:glycoside hydrolase family 43 protein [Treponema sp.]
MNRAFRRILVGTSALFASGFAFVSCAPEGSENVVTVTNYATVKYSRGTSHSTNADQTKWKMANCHDPKLFQDDDGTYYVYATDASTGNIGKVGLHIRYSKDLVNWTGVETSALGGHWDEDFLAWEGFKASSGETLQNNSEYTAFTWAPTVMKQNGMYYMYHGVNADVSLASGGTKWASSIVLSIASSPKGPFYPASYISSYSGSDSDVKNIKSKLEELGVSYSQNFLVKYSSIGSAERAAKSSLDGNEIDNPDYTASNNARFGCIDPEFVYDIATGNLMDYTIGSNKCYAMIYGSWLYGIALCYVDAVSLKPVASSAFTLNEVDYEQGAELDMSLDEANLAKSSGGYGLLGTRIAGGYSAGYEGAQLFFNSGTNYYYLITSCGGLDYEYRCTLGRSESIEGPYLDAGGQSMLLTNTAADDSYYGNYHKIGSKIIGSHVLDGEYSFRCQGGLSVWRNSDGQILFANHARTNFQEGYYFYLQIHQMFFNEDGWPLLNQNEFFNDYSGITDDGKESLCKLTMADIAGEYDTILTVRGTETDSVKNLGIFGADSIETSANKADAVPTESKKMTVDSEGNISGSNYTGTITLSDDGYNATIDLKDSSGNSLGTFKGCFMHALDWAKKNKTLDERRVITFTTLCSDSSAEKAGEYFWGNK